MCCKRYAMFILLVAITLLLCSCFNLTASEQAYYKNKDNYVKVSGIIKSLDYNDEKTALYISFTDLDTSLDDNCFKIIGDNFTIVEENGFEDLVKVGDRVSFITAPKYFGDGYVMPIVSITFEDTCFLDFETGYKNFIDWLYN